MIRLEDGDIVHESIESLAAEKGVRAGALGVEEFNTVYMSKFVQQSIISSERRMVMIIPVILAGGSGTRLWPLSRRLFPKQLLRLAWDRTLLQETILRVAGGTAVADPIIICNESYRYIIAEQLREIHVKPHSLVLEPAGRNTAPAVTVSAIMAASVDPEAMILVLPSDHLIPDIPKFHQALDAAACFAGQGSLVTFGVVPQAPETGYGYIRKNGRTFCTCGALHAAFEIEAFVEKPDFATARKYIESGEYCWNSGMFMFRAVEIIREMEALSPEILDACRLSVEKGALDEEAFLLDADAFSECPSDSIDYAVMEKTRRGVMVPFDAGWNDVGSWEALWELGEKDDCGNVVKGDVVGRDNRDCLIFAESRLVAVLGMNDAVVVESPDAVLVAGRGRGQEVRGIVDKLRDEGRREVSGHSKTFCHWGNVVLLSKEETMVVRRVTVNEQAAVRVRTPADRALHWIVGDGEGTLRKPGETRVFQKDAAIRIPPGSDVVFENSQDRPLVFMELYSPGNGEDEHFNGRPEK